MSSRLTIRDAKGVEHLYAHEPIADTPHHTLTRIGNGEVYSVGPDELGRIGCDCPDYRYRRSEEAKAMPCKHGRALIALGVFGSVATPPVAAEELPATLEPPIVAEAVVE